MCAVQDCARRPDRTHGPQSPAWPDGVRGRISAGMSRRILLIDGHPDSQRGHFVHALADAYAAGAAETGQDVRRIEVAQLDFPLIRAARDWSEGTPPPDIAAAQADLRWAEHIVLLYPLWLGDMPALLKAFLEQVARPDFLYSGRAGPRRAVLKGRSAHVVVTMGMPGFLYRYFYGAHSLKSLRRNILNFVGVRPVTETIVGGMGIENDAARAQWLRTMRDFGAMGC